MKILQERPDTSHLFAKNVHRVGADHLPKDPVRRDGVDYEILSLSGVTLDTDNIPFRYAIVAKAGESLFDGWATASFDENLTPIPRWM